MSWPRVINLFSVHFTALESNERKKKTNGDSTQSTRAVIGVGGMGGGGGGDCARAMESSFPDIKTSCENG